MKRLIAAIAVAVAFPAVANAQAAPAPAPKAGQDHQMMMNCKCCNMPGNGAAGHKMPDAQPRPGSAPSGSGDQHDHTKK